MKFSKLYLCAGALGTFFTAGAQREWVDVNSADEFSKVMEGGQRYVRLIADVTDSSTDSYRVTESMTLDLNGHRLELNAPFTWLGSGEFVLQDMSESRTGSIEGSKSEVLDCEGSGQVRISGGLFTSQSKKAVIVIGEEGNCLMDGGRVDASGYCRAFHNNGHLKIAGGTIVGADRRQLAPVFTDGQGLTELTGGAVYAGNDSRARCFEIAEAYAADTKKTTGIKLPEGVFDGGAIVLDESWTIPGSRFINYNITKGQMSPDATHYYFPGADFSLPSCDYLGLVPFAGWSLSSDGEGELLMSVSAATDLDMQLYPVWKYISLPEDVKADLVPESIAPADGSQVESLETITLSYGADTSIFVDDCATGECYLENITTGERTGCTVTADWSGDVTVRAEQPVTANGSYLLFIGAGLFGDDDWYYGDMQEGHCNPDLRLQYTIHNRPTGTDSATAEPASGSTVDCLDTISLTFTDEEEVFKNYSDEPIKLTNEAGRVIASFSAEDVTISENSRNVAILTLPEKVIEADVYTLSVPEGFFAFDWWERDCSALMFSWTVSGTLGIDTAVDLTSPAEYYDVYGRPVKKPQLGEILIRCSGARIEKVIL